MIPDELKKLRWTKKADKPILVKEIGLNGDNRAWLVIDSLANGQAAGGIRMGDRVSLDEVLKLAAEMTLKFSFLNLRSGGAKAGIYNASPLTPGEREHLFLRFGKALGPLLQERIYLPGTDMGTYPQDIDQLLRGAGVVGTRREESLDSGFYTAVSVFSALQATASVAGIQLSGARIGIQGLGKVGLRMVQLAFEHGLKVIAVSTRLGALCSPHGLDVAQIVSLTQKYGDDSVLHYQGGGSIRQEELFAQDLDVLCPCAGLHPIHFGNVDKIKAKIIVSGCNVTATPAVETRLFDRGVIYLPGFVCNSGGILCYTLSNYGFQEKEIGTFLSRGIRHKVISLLIRAKKSGDCPCTVAQRIASKNQERFARESEAMLRGKARMISTRLRDSGEMALIRTALWPSVRSALSGPPSLRRRLARNVLFERFFGG